MTDKRLHGSLNHAPDQGVMQFNNLQCLMWAVLHAASEIGEIDMLDYVISPFISYYGLARFTDRIIA